MEGVGVARDGANDDHPAVSSSSLHIVTKWWVLVMPLMEPIMTSLHKGTRPHSSVQQAHFSTDPSKATCNAAA
jgi:hypothetical protein